MSADPEIEVAWRAGRTAWPTVTVERERFAARAAEAVDLAHHAADLYLAVACRDGNPTALRLFEHHVMSRARSAICSIDSDASFVEEACQRLRSRLLVDQGDGARIGAYAGRGSLQAWVAVAAIRTAITLRRDRQRAKEIPLDIDDLSQLVATIAHADSELALVEQRYAGALRDALREAITRLPPRLRSVLHVRFADDLELDEIASLYGVHRATVVRWVRRACESLLASTREILTRTLGLTPSELNWVITTAHTRLEISLSNLLSAPEDS